MSTPPRRRTRATSKAPGGAPAPAPAPAATPVHDPSPALPTLPSPTNSIGSFGHIPAASSNIISSVRQDVTGKTRSVPWGFSYSKNTCYRNGITIMLLNSDRFMGYIQNWHVAQITAEKASSNVGADYIDMWTELLKLWQTYWTSDHKPTITAAAKLYWTYQDTITDPFPWGVGGQQDAIEYATWIFQAFASTVYNEPPLMHTKDAFDSVVSLWETIRRRCNGCRHLNNVRIRGAVPDIHYLLPLNIDIYDTDAKTGVKTQKDTVTFEQCLNNRSPAIFQGYYCDDCRKSFKASEASKTDVEKDQAEKDRAAQLDYEWRNIATLPEVLLMSFVRFRQNQRTGSWVKDTTVVELVEDVDLAPYFDHALPAQDSTKYKLVGVVAHSGGVNGGHYINYAKVGDQWWFLNGAQKAKQVDFEDINETKMVAATRRDTPRPMQENTPYILCWEKVIPPAPVVTPAIDTVKPAPPAAPEDGKPASGTDADKIGGKIMLRFDRLKAAAIGSSGPADTVADTTDAALTAASDDTGTKAVIPPTPGPTLPAKRAASHPDRSDSQPAAKRTRLQTGAVPAPAPTPDPAAMPVLPDVPKITVSPDTSIPPPPAYPPPKITPPPPPPPATPPAPAHGTRGTRLIPPTPTPLDAPSASVSAPIPATVPAAALPVAAAPAPAPRSGPAPTGNLPYTLHGTLYINGIPHPFSFPLPTASLQQPLSAATIGNNLIDLNLVLEDPNTGLRYDIP